MDGKFGTMSYEEERARGAHHSPVIRTAAVKADNGEYPMGLVAAKNADEDVIPYGEVAIPVTHTGSGPDAVAGGGPLAPVDAVVEILTDGALGTATYKLSLDGGATWGESTTTPADGEIVIGDSGVTLTLGTGDQADGDLYSLSIRPCVFGVLDEKCDTETTTAAMVIVHGSVRLDCLKANIAGDAPDAALLAVLFEAGIYEE